MKPIWKQTVKCTAFILVLILILALLSGLFKPRSVHASYDLNTYHHSGVYGEPRDSLDSLIIGNSLSYLGVSPIEMWEHRGVTSFVCGYAMQQIHRTYENLWHTLETQKPGVILMECDVLYWGIDLEDRFRARLDLALPVFSFHDMWRKFPKSALMGEPAPNYIDDAKGYYPISNVNPYTGGDYMIPSEDREDFPLANRKCLEDIVKLCRDHDIELVLFSVPSPVNWNYARHNAVQDFADKWELTYRDLNLEWEDIGLDWSRHTWDGGDHLNVQGGVILSQFLADWLADSYGLPDRRGQEAYSQWDISAENYYVWLDSDVNHRNPPLREVENP